MSFMQGVSEDDSIVNLTPAQMGVLLTFAPPAASCILDEYALLKFRQCIGKVMKMLNSSISDQAKNECPNLLMTLSYMFLQYEGDRANRAKCDFFTNKIMNDEMQSIKVGDFKKKQCIYIVLRIEMETEAASKQVARL